MAENTEKKILIDVKILDNFVTAKKNADDARKALNDYIKSGEKNEQKQRELAQTVAQTNNEFKEAKTQLEAASKSQDMLAATGEKANKTLGEMQRELKALKNTPLDFGDPKQVREVEQAMADLTAEIDDYKTKIKGLDTGELANNLSAVAEAGVAVVQIGSQIAKISGIESEKFDKLINSTTELIALTQAFGVITETLDKRKLSLVAANIKNISSMAAEKVGAIASAAATFLLGRSADSASVSFKILRGAIIATGLGILLVVLGELIANWSSISAWVSKSATNFTGFGKIVDGVKVGFMGLYEVIKNLLLGPGKALIKFMQGDFKGAYNEINKTFNIVGNAQKGATDQMVRNSENAARKMTEHQRELKSKALLSEAEKLEKSLEVDKARGVSAERLYQKEMIILNKKIVGYKLALQNIKDKDSEAYKEMQKNLDDASLKKIQAETDEKKRIDDIGIKAAEKRKAIAEKAAKAEVDIQNVKSQTIIDKQNEIAGNEKISFDDRKAALEKSEAEQIKIIERNRDLELKNKELTESERKAITEKAAYDIAKLKTDTEKTITDIEAKELDKRLKKQAESLEAKKQQLANKQAADLEDLSKEYANSLKKAKYASDVVAINEQYEKDKLAIAQKYREQDFNESVAAMQAQLDLLPADANARIEIEKAIADAKSKYAQESAAIAIKANEDIAKSHEESVKKQEELEQQLKDKKQELYQQLATTLQDITNGIFERKNQELDQETQSISDSYDKQIAAAEGNDKKQKALEAQKQKRLEEQEKEKRKLAREQAISERLFAAFSIGLSTTKAVMASLAPPPVGLGPIAGIPLSIVTGGIGALQLASVMAAPLPKAQRGKVFKGKSHAQGGIPVEVEGDEIIMTKGVYRNPVLRELASMINQAGGGISFSNPNQSAVFASGGFANAIFTDGGYATRNYNDGNLTAKEIKQAMKEALAEMKAPRVAIDDIRRADENYVKIEDGANY